MRSERGVGLVAHLVGAALLAGCPPATETKVRDLKVVTINLRNNEDFPDERLPLLADEIAALAPDLVGLQEVQISEDQGGRLLAAVQERAPDLTYGFDEQLKVGVAEVLGEGIGAYFLGERKARDALPLSEGRVALFDRVDLGDGLVVDLYDAHLHAGGGEEGAAIRLEQAEAIVDWMAEHDEGRVRFLVGDMNATPDAAAIAAFTGAGLVDTWPHVNGDDPGATSPIVLGHDPDFVQAPARRIDYVFADLEGDVDADVLESVISFDAPNAEGLYPSDHLGVTTTVRLRWEARRDPR